VIKMGTTRVEPGTAGPVVIVSVSGRLVNEDDAEALADGLLSDFDVAVPRLVVNLSGCEILSSASIGALIRAYSRCKKRGGRFALCEMRPAIKHLFEMLQLYRICEHYDTEAQAIAAIGS